MKVEYAFTPPFDWRTRLLPSRVAMYYTGERVGPGRYVCTFCGRDTVVSKMQVLAPCHACDSVEYTLDAVAA